MQKFEFFLKCIFNREGYAYLNSYGIYSSIDSNNSVDKYSYNSIDKKKIPRNKVSFCLVPSCTPNFT